MPVESRTMARVVAGKEFTVTLTWWPDLQNHNTNDNNTNDNKRKVIGIFLMLSPRQPDVLLAKLDCKG